MSQYKTDNNNSMLSRLLSEFCRRELLPESYMDMAKTYFIPLASELASTSNFKNTPLFIGINGCQGSGKSTLAALLERLLTDIHGKVVANMSIDDFYHARITREQLAKDTHPLFITRGVPGTHEINLLQQTIMTLGGQGNIPIPRFDKSKDDRCNKNLWDEIKGPADIIILEGWCIGLSPQPEDSLLKPINNLEKTEDIDGIWRKTVNDQIEKEYSPLFKQIDKLVMLKAPSFQCVYDWRQKQEDKLRKKKGNEKLDTIAGIMDENTLERFIQHYQRLTEHMLNTLPQTADTVFELNSHHQITGRKDNGKP
jgi:D-glycerate 3-kinase